MASRSVSVIGIDTHIVNCNYFCVNKKTAEILGAGEFSTNATNFIKTVTQFPEPRVVIVEQGPLSGWIERILEKHVEEVVVADTKRNSWIAKDPGKNDLIDSEKLAHLYMGGYIKRIVSRSKEKQELISLVIHYHSLVRQTTRLKNQVGERRRGARAYREESIKEDLKYLWHNKGLQMGIRNYHDQLRAVEKQIEEVTKRIQKISCKYPEISYLENFPGIGFVGSSTLSAMIDIPERFSTLKQLWIYCGYGLDQQSSGGSSKRPRITKRGNRYLNNVIKTAAHNIITLCKNDNVYKTWYNENIRKGKDPEKLRANLARKLIKDIWLGWKALNRSVSKQAA